MHDKLNIADMQIEKLRAFVDKEERKYPLSEREEFLFDSLIEAYRLISQFINK